MWAVKRTGTTILPSFPAVIWILVILASLAHAQAQNLAIQTLTNVSQCVPVTVEWTGGVAPYLLIAVPVPITPLDIAQIHANIPGTSLNWTPTFDTGSLALLTLNDSAGAFATSNTFIIAGSDDTSCLARQVTTTTSSPVPTSTAEGGESAGSPSTDTSSDALSGGAIAGIVIGGLVAAALFSFLVMRWRRKRVQAFRRRHRATRSGTSQMRPVSVLRACILTRLCVARPQSGNLWPTFRRKRSMPSAAARRKWKTKQVCLPRHLPRCRDPAKPVAVSRPVASRCQRSRPLIWSISFDLGACSSTYSRPYLHIHTRVFLQDCGQAERSSQIPYGLTFQTPKCTMISPVVCIERILF